MVRPQDPRQPSGGARKLAKDPHRAASFREAARAIVHKDRYDRRAGFSVDTAGAIARALERAYAQSFADAQAPPTAPALSDAAADAAAAAEPVEWILIPPRPRDAFWTICLFTLGRDAAQAADEAGHLHPVTTQNGKPGWQLVSRHGFEQPYSYGTLLPLVRLGLLDSVQVPDKRLVVTALGRATWWRFLHRGGQFSEDGFTLRFAQNCTVRPMHEQLTFRPSSESGFCNSKRQIWRGGGQLSAYPPSVKGPDFPAPSA